MELLPLGEGARPRGAIETRVDQAPDQSAIGPLESMFPHLEAMATLQQSAEGTLAGLRRGAQRLLFRLLRPYAFQQHQLQMQLIAALRQTALALRRQQALHESLDQRVRDLTRELVDAKRDIRRVETAEAAGTVSKPRRGETT